MNNNRGNNNRRRGRGNNNRAPGGGQQVNRIDSRARGNAPQLLEKYRKLAQDAHLNGDRVQAEYYLQFADHYFRVTADARVRLEEQRLRQNGGQSGAPGYQNGGSVSGDRWQDEDGEDEALEFGMDANFAPYERAPQQRREEQPRRDDQPRREDQARREDREPREYRGQRDNRDQRQPVPVAAEAPVPIEGVRVDEGEPIAPVADNPFTRDSRGPRGPRGRNDRRGGRRAENDTPRFDTPRADAPRIEAERAPEAAPFFDPASLPPAIGVRTESVIEAPARPERIRAPKPVAAPAPAIETRAVETAAPAAETPAAPKKRGRPRKNPLPEAKVDAEG